MFKTAHAAQTASPVSPGPRQPDPATEQRPIAPSSPQDTSRGQSGAVTADPASTVAEYCGKLEGFNSDLRLLGPRIRRADLLLRLFNRRESALIS